ncbi:MAG TPA: DinB family protein [Pseudonocardiaceae bacterium]
MSTTEHTGTRTVDAGERADLLESLARGRHFLRFTAQNLTDEQAGHRSTTSELSVGGLIKHVTQMESRWARFIAGGAAAMGRADPEDFANGFRMQPDETLKGLLEDYAEVAARTDELISTLDLDSSWPLPEAPWFKPNTSWTVRRVALHVIAETAQHAGHADIIRETLDGQKSMG